MRKFFLSALLFAGISVSMISCSNGDYTATPAGGTNWNPGSGGGSGGGSVGSGSMVAKINGTQWNSSSGMYTVSSGIFMGMGVNSAGALSLNILNYTGPGTYTIDGTTTTVSYLQGTTNTLTTSGQIVVSSEANNVVQGTFSASGNGLTITDGAFNLNKQ